MFPMILNNCELWCISFIVMNETEALIQRRIENPVNIKMELHTKILNGIYLLTIFWRRSILYVWQGSEYASGTSRRITNGTS